MNWSSTRIYAAALLDVWHEPSQALRRVNLTDEGYEFALLTVFCYLLLSFAMSWWFFSRPELVTAYLDFVTPPAAVQARQAVELALSNPGIVLLVVAWNDLTTMLSLLLLWVLLFVVYGAVFNYWKFNGRYLNIFTIPLSILAFGVVVETLMKAILVEYSEVSSLSFFLPIEDKQSLSYVLAHQVNLFKLWYLGVVSAGIKIRIGRRYLTVAVVSLVTWFSLGIANHYLVLHLPL